MGMVGVDARRSGGIAFLAGSLAACALVAGLGGYWTGLGLGPWYDGLTKPAWNPPSWVFGPVWTTLYVLMAVAAWMVWRVRGWSVPLGLYGVQLVLNLAWPGIFFGLRMPGPAFFEIAVLWAVLLATLISFFRARPVAGVLLVPYLIWVTYASALNFALWRLNGSVGP